MNIAYFLTPKSNVAYLYDDSTFRQGLEKMRRHSYSAIPVITRDGKYAGTVSEGDFLWHLLDANGSSIQSVTMKRAEDLHIRDILNTRDYPPVRITVSMEKLLGCVLNRNFVPVMDDLGNFTGIVTRKDVLQYFAGSGEPWVLQDLALQIV